MRLYLHRPTQLEPDAVEVAVDAVIREGLDGVDDTVSVLVEDTDEPLDVDATFEATDVVDRIHIHIGPVVRIGVTVNYNGLAKSDEFSASSRIERVFDWAVSDNAFDLGPEDATEHALAVCGTENPLAPDVHLGSLPQDGPHHVCLDLVPKHRFQG